MDQLIEYVLSRSNAFEVNVFTVSNRSAEFREMFGFLINYLFKEGSERLSMEAVRKVLDQFRTVKIFYMFLTYFFFALLWTVVECCCLTDLKKFWMRNVSSFYIQMRRPPI